MNFAERLRYLRASKGITQEKLANDIEDIFKYPITKSTISQYENQKREPNINLLLFFSQYFECSVDYLLGTSEYNQTVDSSELILKTKVLKLFIYIIEKMDGLQLHRLHRLLIDFKRNNELD